MLLGHRARVFPRLASSAGLGVVVGLAQGLEEVPVPLASAFGQEDHVADLPAGPALVMLHSASPITSRGLVLGVAVPADVGSGGEPAHGHGVGLSTLQNFGLGLALEVHVPAELGMPVDLLAHGDALLTSWAFTWVSGLEAATAVCPGLVAQLAPTLRPVAPGRAGRLRSCAHCCCCAYWFSCSWWCCCSYSWFLFLLVRGLLVLFCLVRGCNTQFGVHRRDIGHSWVVLLCPRT